MSDIDRLVDIADTIDELLNEYKKICDIDAQTRDKKTIVCLLAIYHPNKGTWIKTVRE